jgi:geranylgeranylglycerol-phosphate geranylgeranyltransferase
MNWSIFLYSALLSIPRIYSLQNLSNIRFKLEKLYHTTTAITRAKNILPVILLNIAGSRIANPVISPLQNGPVLASIAITQCIMASSMIINDICDLPIDRINNPTRPLVSGDLSTFHAKCMTAFFLAAAETINVLCIPPTLRWISRASSLLSVIYTPALKRILFVKNIACAALVSTSILFSGLAANPDIIIGPRAYLLYIATRAIFLGSICSEILLDIRDRDGDRHFGVPTIPVVFGKEAAWKIANGAMLLNVWMGAVDMSTIGGNYLGMGFATTLLPLITGLRNIRDQGYSREAILGYGSNSCVPLVAMLVYLGGVGHFFLHYTY